MSRISCSAVQLHCPGLTLLDPSTGSVTPPEAILRSWVSGSCGDIKVLARHTEITLDTFPVLVTNSKFAVSTHAATVSGTAIVMHRSICVLGNSRTQAVAIAKCLVGSGVSSGSSNLKVLHRLSGVFGTPDA
jgi:hypothetical protein